MTMAVKSVGYSPVVGNSPAMKQNNSKLQSQQVKQNDSKLSKKNVKKQVGFLVAAHAVLAAGFGAVCLIRMKKGGSFKSVLKNIKTLEGNNKVVSDSFKKSVECADEMIKAGKDDYKKVVDYVKSLLKPCDKSLLPKDGIVYHGTSIKNAKEIVKNGITPFVPSVHGNELGSAVYTTPDHRVAEFLSEKGVVLPFKLNSDKIAHISEKDLKSITQVCGEMYYKYAPSTKYFKESGVELPTYMEVIGKAIAGTKNTRFADSTIRPLLNRVLRDAGYEAVYMDKAVTARVNPLFGQTITNVLEKEKGILQSQFAVLDGTKLELVKDKLYKVK